MLNELHRLGADLEGVAPCDVTQSHGNKWQSVIDKMPEAKSVVVFGVRMIDSTLVSARKNIRVPQFSTKCLHEEMDRIAFGISGYRDDLGYHAIPFPHYWPVEMGKESKGLIGDISHRHTAYQAGIGTIAKSRLLITERFGPRIRLFSILTDAPLKLEEPSGKEYLQELRKMCQCLSCMNEV